MPPEITEELIVGTITPKHLDLYEWGTSNPITSRLQSTHFEDFVSENFYRAELGVTSSTVARAIPDDPQIGGITALSAERRTLAKITCGEASYLERVSPGRDMYWLMGVVLLTPQPRTAASSRLPLRDQAVRHAIASSAVLRQSPGRPSAVLIDTTVLLTGSTALAPAKVDRNTSTHEPPHTPRYVISISGWALCCVSS